MKLLKVEKSFKKELKRQIRYVITSAVGFIIAYSWRDSIIKYFDSLTLTSAVVSNSSFFFHLSSSVLTTIFGVVLILLSSRLLQD